MPCFVSLIREMLGIWLSRHTALDQVTELVVNISAKVLFSSATDLILATFRKSHCYVRLAVLPGIAARVESSHCKGSHPLHYPIKFR